MASGEAKEAVCRGCGKPIVWGITTEGKRISIDLYPPVYKVIPLSKTAHGVETVERIYNLGIDHFAVCPKAWAQ